MIFETVAETKDYVLIYKPAGIPTQSRDVTVPDLYHALLGKCEEPSVINRLDQPVEGLVLFAKGRKNAAFLSEEMRLGNIRKEYACAVHGVPDEKRGVLKDLLLHDKRTNFSKTVPQGTKDAKYAELEYEVLDTAWRDGEIYSLLRIILKTGRHHQIRVQLSAMGCPIAGDRKYGNGNDKDIRFPALCARALTFKDPGSKKTVSFTAEPKGEIFRLFKKGGS